VHGEQPEQPIEGLGGDDRVRRPRELQSDQECFDAPDEKEREGRRSVQDADPLVVDRRQPRPHLTPDVWARAWKR
jgi:hypothetical protein